MAETPKWNPGVRNPLVSGLHAWLISCFLLVFCPDCLEACGLCVFAAWDMTLPPVSLWMISISCWFLALGAVASRAPHGLSGTWGLTGSLVVLILIVMLSALLGPLAFMILLLRPWKVFRAARQPACREQWGEPACRRVRQIGFTALAVLAALALLSAFIRAERPASDWILKWQNTGPALGRAHKIEKGIEIIPLDQLRQMVRQGSPAVAAAMARPLAETGTATEDVPLLIDALASCEARLPQSEREALKVETALQSLTGFPLATGTSAAEWRQRWAAVR